MSRPPRVTHIEDSSRRDSDSLQHGHSIFTWRPDEFVFSPGDFTGRGVQRKWPRSAVRGFHAELVGSRTTSLPRGRLVMSLHDGSVVELVSGGRMAHVVVLAQRLEDLRNGIRPPPADGAHAGEPLPLIGTPEIKTERRDGVTVITVRPTPGSERGQIRFEVGPTTVSMSPRIGRFGGEPPVVTWNRASIVDVTVSQRRAGRSGMRYFLQVHFARGTQTDAIEDRTYEAQVHSVMVALRGALELPTRAEAARRWLGTGSSRRPGDATSPGDVLPYAPEPQDQSWIERTPGLFRAFFPREKPKDAIYSIRFAIFAVVATIFIGMIVARWLAQPVRIGLPLGVATFCAFVVAASAVLPSVQRCLEYRTVEVSGDARLVLSVRSPFQNSRRTWDVDEIREVMLYPHSVSVRLAKHKVELASFRKRADARAFAETIGHALGFAAKPTCA